MQLKLDQLPVIKQAKDILSKIKIPGFSGMSLYDLLERYLIGIIKGALTTRASGISFSFFMAIFICFLFLISSQDFKPFTSLLNKC